MKENKFFFIIPLSPESILSPERKILQKLCLDVLQNQHYKNWKALLIGEANIPIVDERVLQIKIEATKEKKLVVATDYILQNKIDCDYIIRLDDDDVFNPFILKEIASLKFDVMTDKYHHFWNPANGMISSKVKYWFPNTCIIKKEIALKPHYFNHPNAHNQVNLPLIANSHDIFHLYFNEKHKIIISKENTPLYLRTISTNSITYNQASDIVTYMNSFGIWKKNSFRSFQFLNTFKYATIKNSTNYTQSLKWRIREFINNIIALKNYNKVVIYKTTFTTPNF